MIRCSLGSEAALSSSPGINGLAWKMLVPNFFIVGAPKCGTTAMAQYLREHPGIFMTYPKEPQYFVRHIYAHHGPDGPPSHRVSEDAYLGLYDNAGAEHIAVGEATAIYLQSKRAMQDLFAFNSSAKIIAMIRQPIELARSWHGQELREREEVEYDFETAWRLQGVRSQGEALDHRPQRPSLLQYRQIASVGSQLETLLEIFPCGQVKINLLEDMAINPAKTYRDNLDFLGVPNDGRSDFPVVKPSKVVKSQTVGRALNDTPKSFMAPYLVLKRSMGLEARSLGLRRWLRERLAVRRLTISGSLDSELAAYFEPEITKVEHILGRRLPEWRTPSHK